MNKIVKTVIEWIVIIGIAFGLSILIRNFVVDTRIVPTGSMLPTIQEQDRLIVDRLFYQFQTLGRGDVIVFKAPEKSGSSEDLVKRIIGLPGEKVQIKNSKVYINEAELKEPYVHNIADYEYGPVTVPANSYLVLGDNRSESYDSHKWGFLPAENILGKVLIRYWPLNTIGPLEGPPADYLSAKEQS
ncbi:signal peptidase I [Syntrophobotulus glycolicus DSM 8271]|uniref:Signal peptidase I n=1 Tax=Syntrophobotulus glycolicus (strain DSM 8271 / FlGlyR) TaxID=645991 RepID=F0SYY5_SYNGF|nr:signal peptidase I [Syntrophobotulus glycolicus]ADY56022.1 signal peptidase I [Syntrophobotulus glycolicus DSM 8271]